MPNHYSLSFLSWLGICCPMSGCVLPFSSSLFLSARARGRREKDRKDRDTTRQVIFLSISMYWRVSVSCPISSRAREDRQRKGNRRWNLRDEGEGDRGQGRRIQKECGRYLKERDSSGAHTPFFLDSFFSCPSPFARAKGREREWAWRTKNNPDRRSHFWMPDILLPRRREKTKYLMHPVWRLPSSFPLSSS